MISNEVLGHQITSIGVAGETGSIESLYEIIHQDAFILERIDQVPFIDTPLHKAASAGHIAFATEMMTLKPSFFRKLNPDGLSPMHLALRNDRFQWVLMLSKIDKSLLRVKAREGMTPFHYVVEKGNLNLIKQFLEVSPECIIDLTVKGETALHIALKEDRVEALVYIVHWLHRRCFQYVENAEYWPRKVLNWGDLEGNTVLHVAAKRNEAQVVKRLLLTNQIDKEARNSEGLTALDIIERERHRNLVNNDEIRLMICRSVQNLKISGFGQPKALFAKIINNFFHIEVALCRASLNMRNETRSAFLVVAGLILAATYNASLNPPGGLWTSADRSASMNISSNHTHNGTSSSPQHMPGTSITGEAQFFLFWFANTTTFWLILMLVTFLLPVGYLSMCFLFSLAFLGLCYVISMVITRPTPVWNLVNGFGFFLFNLFPTLIMYRLSHRPFFNVNF